MLFVSSLIELRIVVLAGPVGVDKP